MLKSITSNLKKSWKLIVICITIVSLSYVALLYHYVSRDRGREDTTYLIESKILDWKMRNRGPEKEPTKVGILAIDEKALTDFGRWPFSRRFYAQAFDNLKKLGVKWIGFDVVWAEPEKTFLEDAAKEFNGIDAVNYPEKVQRLRQMVKTSPSDLNLIQGIKNFENVVLGYFYFGSTFEAKLSAGHRDPFRGLDKMSDSAIQLLIMPEGRDLESFPQLPRGYGIVSNTDLYSASSDYYAFFSNDADDDAINRWVTMVANINGNLMSSLSLRTAAEYLNREIIVFFNDSGVENIGLVNRDDEDDVLELPVDPNGGGRLLLNHRGPGRSFRYFSLADAYHDRFTEEEKKELKGSLLLLGPTATGINDLRPNPFDPAIVGVENHAAAIDNILRQDFLKRPRSIFVTELWIIGCVGLFFAPLMIWGRAAISGIAAVAFLIGYYYVDKYFWFGRGTWTYMAIPCVEITSMFILTNLFKYISEEKDKKFLKEAFGSYISPELIDEMYGSGEPPQLGGKSGPLTAYFTDIQSFSSFSEKLTATQLVELLNEYLTAMTDILLEDKGTLDKYEGDAIIAFFGAPMSLPDHAARACTVAVRMQDKLLELREKWVSEGDKWPDIVKNMRMRIGINSGEIVTGNMGSRDRMNYTMMGDSVNLAARLEEAAKQYGIFTQVSQFTKDLTEDGFIMRELDTIRVVGKTEPVTTFDLLGIKGETSDLLLNLQKTFHEALALYKNMKWDEAKAGFEKSLELEYQRFPDLKGKKTNPSEIYIERCNQFKEDPPGEDWDGVYTLTSK